MLTTCIFHVSKRFDVHNHTIIFSVSIFISQDMQLSWRWLDPFGVKSDPRVFGLPSKPQLGDLWPPEWRNAEPSELLIPSPDGSSGHQSSDQSSLGPARRENRGVTSSGSVRSWEMIAAAILLRSQAERDSGDGERGRQEVTGPRAEACDQAALLCCGRWYGKGWAGEVGGRGEKAMRRRREELGKEKWIIKGSEKRENERSSYGETERGRQIVEWRRIFAKQGGIISG